MWPLWVSISRHVNAAQGQKMSKCSSTYSKKKDLHSSSTVSSNCWRRWDWCTISQYSRYPGLWHFKNGISFIFQWTCCEHKEMQWIFAGLLIGAIQPAALCTAVVVIFFIYYSQLQVHTSMTVTWHFHHASLLSFAILTNPDHSRFCPLTPNPDLNICGLRRIFC